MAQKYDPPSGPPPQYQYGSDVASPAPAHINPPFESQSQQYPAQAQGQYPPQGYFQPGPGPQMGYAPQGGYYGQQQPGPYGPQGAYAGPQGYGPNGYAPGYGPQGQYLDDRRGASGSGSGFYEACLASLACCCCLDCLLF